MQDFLDVVGVVIRDRVAIRLLIAAGDDRGNAQRIILGSRLRFFDQHAQHAATSRGGRGIQLFSTVVVLIGGSKGCRGRFGLEAKGVSR